ncbi:hypothetical protein FR934_02050 [Synechocystis sp. PCC 6803]|nr:hypothetical protein C7I86_06685 [Synechocystis sp. IPPAS B-1465]MCW5239506.1 hypothetical protein [Synechocystis sp. PCC 6803]NHL97278.1 hypothetical protein [Synechocystis sp. PCC 6803]
MPNFQTFVAIVTTLLVFLTGVGLKYDTIYLRNYEISIPQWAEFSFPGLTFSPVQLVFRGYLNPLFLQCILLPLFMPSFYRLGISCSVYLYRRNH